MKFWSQLLKKFIAVLILSIATIACTPAQSVQLGLLGDLRFDLPIPNAQVSSPNGFRTDVKIPGRIGGGDSIHMGLDLIPAANRTASQVKNTQVLAAEKGKVITVYPPPGGKYRGHVVYGGCVVVRHLVGVYYGKSVYADTLYGHLKAVWVKEGQEVDKGFSLGLMGSTGQSTGPHLHFEILFDPMDLLIYSRLEESTDAPKIP
jgi:murein DD-endopeptidase MepM/ murein hydrolase activator NlpD